MLTLDTTFIHLSGSWDTHEVDMYAPSGYLNETTAAVLLAQEWAHTIDGVGKNAIWILEWRPTEAVSSTVAVAIEDLAQALCAELNIETRYSWTSKSCTDSGTFKPVYVLT